MTWDEMTWYWYVMCRIKFIKVGIMMIAQRVRSELDLVGFDWLLVAQPVWNKALNAGGTLYEP